MHYHTHTCVQEICLHFNRYGISCFHSIWLSSANLLPYHHSHNNYDYYQQDHTSSHSSNQCIRDLNCWTFCKSVKLCGSGLLTNMNTVCFSKGCKFHRASLHVSERLFLVNNWRWLIQDKALKLINQLCTRHRRSSNSPSLNNEFIWIHFVTDQKHVSQVSCGSTTAQVVHQGGNWCCKVFKFFIFINKLTIVVNE